MTTSERAKSSGGENEAESEFAQNAFQSMFDIFWNPEIERRDGHEATGPLRKALAIMRTGRPAEILLNDEADLVANANSPGPIERGDPIAADDIGEVSDLRPLRIDEEAGWWPLLRSQTAEACSHSTSAEIGARDGDSFSSPASTWRSPNMLAPLAASDQQIEDAHACAELIVTSIMYLTDEARSAFRKHSSGLGSCVRRVPTIAAVSDRAYRPPDQRQNERSPSRPGRLPSADCTLPNEPAGTPCELPVCISI
jgi:hypothetical protein